LGIPPIGEADDDANARYWPADLQLLGKDILWFHAVYWPCMLMALELPLPRCIFAHGWWTSEGKKMSKSLGNFVSREVIAEICREYSVDVYRYFLLRAVTFGSDGDFSREMLRQRYNTDLANGVGNLLSRTTNMISRYFDGVLPACGEGTGLEPEVLGAASALAEKATSAMAGCHFHEYLDAILELATATNVYIEKTEPFKLAKDETQREKLGTILYHCAEAVRLILLYLNPLMPEMAAKGLAYLSYSPSDQSLSKCGRWGVLKPGIQIIKGDPLFPRVQ
jgi:methionyl-tRNA synthetase